MMGGRLGRELLTFASEFMKRFTGGELSTTVVASTVFGGVSGSAVANASALGSVLIPWQKKCGYPGALCAANIATSAVHRHPDPAVDPDDPLLAGQRHQRRGPFIAGILPGLLMAGGFIVLCWWIAKRRGYRKTGVSVGKAELMRLALKSARRSSCRSGSLSSCASASRRRPRSPCWPSCTRCCSALSSTATSIGRGSRRRWSRPGSPPAS